MKRNNVKTALTGGLLLGCLTAVSFGMNVSADVDVSVFDSGAASVGDTTMQYRLYDPEANGYEAESFPLVLFLHGEDAVGTDNEAQLTANEGATLWVEMADTNPAYVLAPQAENDDWTTDENMALVMQALDDVIAEYNVDTDRIYVEGMSMGGTGTWKLLLDYPDLFAAGMPICGMVPEEYYEDEDAFAALVNMPIWMFHEADDDVIPVEEATKAAAALQDAGCNCLQYEEWTAGAITPAHEIWNRVYEIGTPYNWLMMQSRTRTEDNTIDPTMLFAKRTISDNITVICDYFLGQIYVIQDGDDVLVIDSGMGGYGAADLYAYIRDEVLIDKDAEFDVVITHNHGDHILGLPSLYESGKVKTIYINEADQDTVFETMEGFDIDITDIVEDLSEGDILTVGDSEIEIVQVPAHTAGSIVLLYNDYMITSDAIGSGDLWLLGAFTVEDSVDGIQHLIDVIDEKDIDYTILTGHYENKAPFTVQYARDILSCAQGIVDGSIEFVPYTRRVGEYATYGSGNIFFQESEIFSLE